MPDGNPRRHRAAMAGVGFLGALITLALGLLIALALGWRPGVTVTEIEDVMRAWGPWGVALSMALMVLHSFVPFPAEFLALANGMLYGPLWGTVVTWSGAMLGAYAAFGLSRLLGRPFAEIMIARRNWHVLDDWTAREGGQVLLVSRLIPVISFNLINYAAGLTRMSWWTFTWATALGILPLTVLMVVMGDSAEAMAWEMWLLVGAGAILAWIALRRYLRPRPKPDRVQTKTPSG